MNYQEDLKLTPMKYFDQSKLKLLPSFSVPLILIFTTAILLLTFFFTFFAFCNSAEEPLTKNLSDSKLKAQIAFKGKIIFQSNIDGDNDIYLLTSAGLKQLTDNTWQDEYPVWSPDGKKIAFTADRKGQYDIYIMKSDGTEITPITSSPADEMEPAWFPDSRNLAFSIRAKKILGKKSTLYKVNLNTRKTKRIIPNFSKSHGIANISPSAPLITFTGKRTLGWDTAIFHTIKKQVIFLNQGGKSCRTRFSDDGKKLAYVSSKADGKGDIWLMNPDGTQKTRLTKRDNTYDYFPSWSPDGNYIVFNSSLKHDHNGKLLIVKVKTGEVFFLFDSPGNDVFPDWHK